MSSIAIIDPGMGNLRSVLRAFQYCGANTEIISKPELVQGHDALVFPGQGAIVDCMKHLSATGFDLLIREWIAADKPFFGICLGLQALFDHSEEGDTPALGIFLVRYAASSFLETSKFHTWVGIMLLSSMEQGFRANFRPANNSTSFIATTLISLMIV